MAAIGEAWGLMTGGKNGKKDYVFVSALLLKASSENQIYTTEH